MYTFSCSYDITVILLHVVLDVIGLHVVDIVDIRILLILF